MILFKLFTAALGCGLSLVVTAALLIISPTWAIVFITVNLVLRIRKRSRRAQRTA